MISIFEVFKEEENMIGGLAIHIKNDDYFKRATYFLNVLVVFLRKTGKILNQLELQIKDLGDNKLQEIFNNLAIQPDQTKNCCPLHITKANILLDLPGKYV